MAPVRVLSGLSSVCSSEHVFQDQFIFSKSLVRLSFPSVAPSNVLRTKLTMFLPSRLTPNRPSSMISSSGLDSGDVLCFGIVVSCFAGDGWCSADPKCMAAPRSSLTRIARTASFKNLATSVQASSVLSHDVTGLPSLGMACNLPNGASRQPHGRDYGDNPRLVFRVPFHCPLHLFLVAIIGVQEIRTDE